MSKRIARAAVMVFAFSAIGLPATAVAAGAATVPSGGPVTVQCEIVEGSCCVNPNGSWTCET